MKKIMTILLIVGTLVSCNNNEDGILSDDSFLIFGHFYGECLGEGCMETFKLTNKELLEDTLDDYSGTNLEFVALDNTLFELVKDLPDAFPPQLLVENETILGCPDCADGGGLFIQYSRNGTVKSWRIDQDKANVPDYLHNFIDQVNQKIRLINS